jgi:hypothetical protein
VITSDVTVSRRLVVTGAVALSLIALVSCGSSTTVTVTTTKTTAPPALTKEEFIAKADAICKELNANTAARNEVDAAQTALQANETPATRARLATAMRTYATEQRVALDKFRVLEPPPADRATIFRYEDGLSHGLLLFESLASAIEKNEVSRARVLYDEAESNVNRQRGLAQGYGFKECGTGSK